MPELARIEVCLYIIQVTASANSRRSDHTITFTKSGSRLGLRAFERSVKLFGRGIFCMPVHFRHEKEVFGISVKVTGRTVSVKVTGRTVR
jgi:hypothetical protein